MKTLIPVFMIVLLLTLFAGCFPGGGSYSPDDRAGFFSGVWHGWIAPLSLIIGLFTDGVRVYEPNNTGWWYYIAVIAGFGGIALSRKKKKHEQST